MHIHRTIALIALPIASSVAAQTLPPPQNVLQLSATGTVEVTQDQISITLSTGREGRDPVAIQTQLKAAVETALAEARRAAEPGQMQVRTGAFSVGPRYTNTGRDGWQGTAEVVLEGRDFARIAQVAGKVSTMTVANVTFSLSREQRAKVESEAQLIAIERFKVRAGELAKGFGFSGYSLREAAVSSSDPGWPHPPRPYAAATAMRAESAPVPVEAGKSAVTVTVSGSVQLR